MKKFAPLLLYLLITVGSVHAQSNPYYKVTPEGSSSGSVRITAAQNEFAACVHATWCNRVDAGCTITTPRRVRLQTAFQRHMSTVPTYVIMCTGTGNGQICTSGDSTADMKIYGRDNAV